MSKTRNKLKLTGLLLTVVMIVSLLGAFSLTAGAAAADDLTVTIDTGASVTLKDTDGDGYYEIENADGLYAFAALTDAQNHQNVELTNNIIVNDVTFTYANNTLTVTDKEGNTVDVSTLRAWTPIGKNQNSHNAYNKVIEGNGYYISGLYCNTTTEANGLFARTGTGIKIKNLGVVNSFIGKSKDTNGTFIGVADETTIQNCYSNAIIVGYHYTGGFVGKARDNNNLTIENSCYFGTLVNMYNGGVFCSEYHYIQNINNSYYLDGCAKFVENEAAVVMTAEQFATGEVAYKLGDAWGQTIGTDAYPSLGGAKVYYGYTSCADDAVKIYTNIPAGDTKPEHSGITYEVNANDNTKHDKKYSCCNKVLIEEHTGGTATCVAKAVCAHCGTSYGELGGHSFVDSKCTVCGAACTHSSFADGKCTACGIPGGYCGREENEGGHESLWWYFQDGTLTISGAGDMAAMHELLGSGFTWRDQKDSITALVIDKGVTGISSSAFSGLTELKSVIFAEGSLLTAIGNAAFSSCSSLTEITIPAGVTDIVSNPFIGCTAMNNVFVASGNTVYKDIEGVLYTADGTTLLYYPHGQTLSGITFIPPKGVTTIGNSAFAGTKVRSVELTNDLTTVGESAFDNCTMLYEITISNSVKEIDESAFWRCTELRSVHAPCGWQENPLYEFENNDYIGNEYVNVRIDAHDLSSWVPNQDGLTHKQVCSACDYVERDNVPHSTTAEGDKAATCQNKAYCSVCKSEYGELADHTPDENTANGNVITVSCSVCHGTVGTATITAENTTYNGTAQETATVAYSEGWIGEKPNVSYENNTNAGTATASITLDEATASVEFTIAKADPSVVPPELAHGQVYEGLTLYPFSSLGSTTGGELQVQVNDREWASPNNYYISDAGTYRVGYRVVGNENYNNVEPVYLTLEIAKRDFSNPAHKVSAVLDAESFVYDGTEKKPAVTVTFDKYVEKDGYWIRGVEVTADNYIVSYSENVNAGTATVTITGTGTNCTGTITKTFKITKAPLTVTAENKTMTTGQSLPPFTYTITGFVNGETEAVLTAKPTVSCEADGQTAGTYNITPSGAAADNYDITYVNGTLSVIDHQHAWTYTADGDTLTATCATADTCPLKTATIKIAAEGKTYDGTPVTATLTGSIDGVVNPTVGYSGNTDAGTHTASITLGEATASVEFTISKADSTLTAPNAITDLVYNGSNQALVSAGSSTTGTVQYKLNDGEWSTNVPTATEAGEYTVYYKLVGDENHKDVAEASVKVAILSKSAVNAEVSFNGNLVYDGNAKTPEITVVFEQKELVPMKDYIVSCSNNVNAGTAAIEITFIGNYEGKVVKSFTIAPRQLVIFWENTNMIYNGNRQTPTAKLFGVIPGDEVGYTVSGWGKFGGTYTAKVEKLTNPNYVLPADATCRFTIDANPIEVAIDVAVDIYDIIPDSAKEAVANAAINAAENALNDAKNAATECINSAVDQITDCVSTKAQEAANTAKSLADALCELWQNLCSRVSCFF